MPKCCVKSCGSTFDATFVYFSMTGGLMLSLIVQTPEFLVLRGIQDKRELMSKAYPVIGFMGIVFMATGMVLLFAALSDQEGFAQVFVWVTFANVLIGFIVVLVTAFECTFYPECLLSDWDWLSASFILFAAVLFLFFWIYFISVSNSYVLQISSPNR